jgi:hypothetical protein
MVKYQIGKQLVQVSMKLPVKLWKNLRLRAVEDDTTATQIVVTLIEDYLSKKKTKKRNPE